MTRYLGGRLLAAAIVLFALSLLAFGMVRLIPGDPALNFVQVDNPDPAVLEAIRQQLGLDRPWYTQYLEWIGGAVTGDFGSSLTRPQQIGEQLAVRFPVSLQLAVMAMLIAVAFGVPLGVMAAVRPGKAVDAVVRGLSFVSLAVPAFIIATVIILVNTSTVRLRLLGHVSFEDDPLGSIGSMLAPAIVLSLAMGAMIARYTRGTVIDALSQDYIRTARAKGASVGRIVVRHALRNALIPVTTIIGVQLAAIIGGTVIIETVFAIPGMGSYLIESINTTDYPAIQACVLVLGAVFIIINLVVDLIYPLIDPRIRVAR
ncbi:ABC transporter permease [Homoserinibacter sp. YIM 151385]|uniref:ABC transporter permease n=1 Tax=Homoserinibacter sp. YIM 151385 TaxID=2985506 RepID=UPI0022F085E9|nr:ABC transporter permease [Homoserinibacter sp. YIM 151385]WBU36716.1 ABC transporter permease [Homoserinibacter sp. YIM 151385]